MAFEVEKAASTTDTVALLASAYHAALSAAALHDRSAGGGAGIFAAGGAGVHDKLGGGRKGGFGGQRGEQQLRGRPSEGQNDADFKRFCQCPFKGLLREAQRAPRAASVMLIHRMHRATEKGPTMPEQSVLSIFLPQ